MNRPPVSPKLIVFNFLCIYLIWGSTYLAIKYAIVALSPFLVAALRFILGGILLLFLSRLRREPRLTRHDLKIAAGSGCLLVLGNALVCYAEKELPSGLVAVVVGTMPVWITLLNWRFFGGAQPRLRQFAGIALALVGIFLLSKSQSAITGSVHPITWMALAISVTSWALGTLWQRRSAQRLSLFTFSGVQLSFGGLGLFISWFLLEGPSSFHSAHVSNTALWAILYLAIFGSVLGSSAYLWLNQHVDPTLVSTYALVNPVIAIWLGWLFIDEAITLQTLLFSLFVVAGLYLVLWRPQSVRIHNARH